MATHSPCAVRARIAFSMIGVLVGVSIFVTFGAVFYNWNAAVWGLASGKTKYISIRARSDIIDILTVGRR